MRSLITVVVANALLALAACGSDAPGAHTATVLWGTLNASTVVRPFALEELTAANASVNPRCPGGGDARGELWHTAFQTGSEGEASGVARYMLEDCRAPQQELAIRGEIRRAFKVRREMQLPPGATDPHMGLTRRDAFWGDLTLRHADHNECHVDVTRLFIGGVYAYSGTLCGHDINSLYLGDRS